MKEKNSKRITQAPRVGNRMAMINNFATKSIKNK